MGNERAARWIGGCVKGQGRGGVRPRWRLFIERRLALVEERVNQRIGLLYGNLDRRLDESGDRIDGHASKAREADLDSPTRSMS